MRRPGVTPVWQGGTSVDVPLAVQTQTAYLAQLSLRLHLADVLSEHLLTWPSCCPSWWFVPISAGHQGIGFYDRPSFLHYLS